MKSPRRQPEALRTRTSLRSRSPPVYERVRAVRKHPTVAPRSDLPPNLRRAANRKSIRGRTPSERLEAAAEVGVLTRHNTRPGTTGRQAVDRVTYRRRKQKRPDLTARQALGHPKTSDRPPVISIFVDSPPRQVLLEGLSRADLSRAAKYDNAVSQLANGRLPPAAFKRRFSTWRPIAGFTLLSDPEAVLALLEQLRAEDRQPFILDSGRT